MSGARDPPPDPLRDGAPRGAVGATNAPLVPGAALLPSRRALEQPLQPPLGPLERTLNGK